MFDQCRVDEEQAYRYDAYLATLGLPEAGSFESKMHAALLADLTDEDGLLTGWHPMAFAAKANSDDTPRWHEAMNGPDEVGFRKAMAAEIAQLESMKAWEVVPREQDKGKNILDGTWAFKRK